MIQQRQLHNYPDVGKAWTAQVSITQQILILFFLEAWLPDLTNSSGFNFYPQTAQHLFYPGMPMVPRASDSEMS